MTNEEEDREQEEFNREADKVAPAAAELGCWGCFHGLTAISALLILPSLMIG